MFSLRIKTVIFDLDDTLYPEITYVYSGFQAVADMLSLQSTVSSQHWFNALIEILHVKGRGRVFDEALARFGLFSPTRVRRCVMTYRSHTPKIALFHEAEAVLRMLNERNIPVYILTDGNKNVQAVKIDALHVSPWIKKAMITHRYTKMHAKPSPYCFQKIAALEKLTPQEIVYIADNPHKDFVGIKPLGFQTARLKQGMFADVTLDSAHEAEQTFVSWNHLKEAIYSWRL